MKQAAFKSWFTKLFEGTTVQAGAKEVKFFKMSFIYLVSTSLLRCVALF